MTARADLVEYGADSSGRPLFFSEQMLVAWLCVLNHPAVRPFAHKTVIVQGAWQIFNGGGAEASAGYHDRDGPLDIRTSNLSRTEQAALVWTARSLGWAAWVRGPEQGMVNHIHMGYLASTDQDPGLASQGRLYVRGFDGLVGNDPDYHPRPNPLVLSLPKEARMALIEDIWNKPILPVGGEAGVDEIPARRMLAQIHNRTSAEVLAAAISKADPSLDAAQVKRAVKAALVEIGGTP